MRSAAAALLLLAFVAVASAEYEPKPKCILPIKRLTCIRDWRSGFVAGIQYGYGSGNKALGIGGLPGAVGVCSGRINNQTSFDMSLQSGIDLVDAQDGIDVPYTESPYYYPPNSPITQVIVLEANNPWGNKFGTVPAILFGYLTPTGDLNFAVCGNAAYAAFYLNPSAAAPPPTPVTLKSVYTSPLSEDGVPAVLGGFYAKCSTRGSGYLGGDPNTSSKYFIKSLTKVCFTPLAHINITVVPPPSPPEFDVDYSWWDNLPFVPCHYDKKEAKKSASASCAATGTVIATGKYGAIVYDKNGNAYDWETDHDGNYQQVNYKGAISMGSDPDTSYLSEEVQKP